MTKRIVAVMVGGALVLGACGDRGERSELTGSAVVADSGTSAQASKAGEAFVATGGAAATTAAPLAARAASSAFIPTTADDRSTFAVDVDTGSYTLARKALGLDRLPDPATVRPEEFVNYFEQDYRRPDGAGFAINVDGAESPFNAGKHLVRVGLATRAITPADRTPVALTVVLDVSGSMADDGKLDTAKLAIETLRKQLRPDDGLAVVVYSDTAREVAIDDVAGLQPQSGTNVEAGVRLGYEVAQRTKRAGATSRIVLMSDGVANIGATGPDDILHLVGESADRGIGLVAIGVGFGEYRDDLLEQLADKGDGFYVYVDDEREIQRVLVQRLTSTLSAQAKDVKVQVQFDPAAVARYRLIGYENRAVADEDFTRDSVDAGEVGPGHTVTALYELELAEATKAAALGTVSVRWADPATGKVATGEATIDVDSVRGAFNRAAPRMQLAGAVASFADVLRASDSAPAGGLAAVGREVDRIAALLGADADVAELQRLVAKAAALTTRN